MSHVRPLLFPRSVAIVGASPRNEDAVLSAVEAGIRAYGVNPGREEVLGLRCWPSHRRPARGARDRDARSSTTSASRRRSTRRSRSASARSSSPASAPRRAPAAEPIDRAPRREGARARAASMVGPNCMGVVVPGRRSDLDRAAAADTTLPGHVAMLCQSGSMADAFLSLGGRVGVRCVVSLGAEAVTGVADYLDVPRRGRRDARDRPLPRDGAAPGGLRGRSGALRRGRQARRVPEGRPLGGGGPRGALAHRRARRLGSRVLGGPASLPRDRGARLPRAHRDARDPRAGALARGARGSPPSRSRAASAGCSPTRPRPPASPTPRSPPSSAARLIARFPNYVDPGNPLDCWAVAPAEEIYPGSLELLAASGEFDVLQAQVDLSQFRDRGNDDWSELTLRAVARLADEHDLFAVATTVHSADPPATFQELARELDLALLRGPRDALTALAQVARWTPASVDGRRPRASR